MIKNNQRKTKTENTKHACAVLKSVCICRGLVKSRRAVSTVISNLILIAAVIAVGFVALSYANSVSNNHVIQYGQAVNEDIDQLREEVAFEYAFYNSSTRNLTAFFMNAGSIGNIWINSMKVSNSTWSYMWNWTTADRPMNYLNNSVAANLDISEEAFIVVTLPQSGNYSLATGNVYSVKLITGRGSFFAYNFVA